VNGLGQTTASFARALGPAFGGSLWSFSETLRFPYHQFLAFLLTALFALVTYVSSLVLSEQLNVPRAERGRRNGERKVVVEFD
jgi:hypothetical protein